MACRVKRSVVMIAPRTYGLAAAAISAASSGFELIRVIVTGGVERGYAAPWSIVFAITFAIVMGITAVGLALHRQLGYVAGVFAVVIAMSNGISLRAAGNLVGIAYLFVGALMFPAIVRSLPYYRAERTAT
jgi:hypothetical protein